MILKIPPALVFAVTAFLMWCIFKYMPFQVFEFSVTMWIPKLLALTGTILGALGVIQFSSSKTTIDPHTPEKVTSLVSNGVYRFSRNPMYLGLLMLLIAFAFYLGTGLSFVMIPIFIWYMNTYQIKPEEEILIHIFGDEYKEYQKKVRRWI